MNRHVTLRFETVPGGPLPDQLGRIAAESGTPLTPDISCANQAGEPE